ncbi:CCA tRNA nucleotidyltransferase [Litoreibacter roseus]|uniref:Poly(A) polymerase n=1 Tax=Litoreibacter roseus TaxID=2601869 RepID=A0A6N6JHG5_9RHOB|nr:CCA tRNA nucleotidyltransferase [Litoreibacter roseus]GFE64728.1 poly(A) polymerase [Litoreibacter roseus]
MKMTWAIPAETHRLMDLMTTAGHQVFCVGGCVRNGLLGVKVDDIDIATDALPQTVMSLADSAGLKVVPTGIEHGTVTVLIDGTAHEITTFRRDVATDGRRAVVAFSDDLHEDAARRDFTINALYMAADGTISDPVCGLPDLENRTIRFIGDPAQRIREDYLRILRFFRFHAWYGRDGIEADGLSACAELADGLDQLSGERIGAEMKKLLSAPDPAPAVASMSRAGILRHVMPGAETDNLAVLVHLETGKAPDWLRRAATLGGEDVTNRWRLSRTEAKTLRTLTDLARLDFRTSEMAYRHGRDLAENAVLIRCALLGQPLPANLAHDLTTGAEAVFPIKAHHLTPDYDGPALGAKLKELEDRWIASGFQLSQSELLA